ncbi:MAG: response regulator transcription factor [Eubacterium sp.]|nr:response regulator transcription factor [Eubacterium sp.]
MIYCVEDDSSIRELMIYTLNSAGFEAVGCGDGRSLYEALAHEKPELIMLDIMLPDEDGISILKKLREEDETRDVPVIMATAKGTEYDKVIGLDLGADDYLAKPFGMMEMVSRVKAVLRRYSAGRKDEILRCGDLMMNLTEHTVAAAGRPVNLALKEFDILKLLMENPGAALSRERLLREVWGLDFIGESRTIDVHINTLRTKLGSCGSSIKTVRGVGYRMDPQS